MGDNPPLHVQRGKVFPEEGPALAKKDYPDWFLQEYEKIPPDRQKVYGLVLNEAEPSGPQNLRSSEPEPEAEEPAQLDLEKAIQKLTAKAQEAEDDGQLHD